MVYRAKHIVKETYRRHRQRQSAARETSQMYPLTKAGNDGVNRGSRAALSDRDRCRITSQELQRQDPIKVPDRKHDAFIQMRVVWLVTIVSSECGELMVRLEE